MSEEKTFLKDIDQGINEIILDNIKLTGDLFREQKFMNAYFSLRNIWTYIEHYEFDSHNELNEITRNIDQAINAMNGKPINQAQKIEVMKSHHTFLDLLNKYYSLIIKGLIDLNKFMKVYPTHSFNDKFMLGTVNVEIKKIPLVEMQEYKDLVVKDSEYILKLLSKKNLEEMHTRHIINEVTNNV